MLGEVALERLRQVEPASHSRRAGVRREELAPRAAGSVEPLAGLGAPPNGASPRRSSTIQSRVGSRPGAGVESRSSSSAAVRAASPASAAGSVADVLTTSEVAGSEEAAAARGSGAWTMLPSARRRDQQAHVVAREPARLGRLVRLEAARQLEGGRAHAATPTSSRAR